MDWLAGGREELVIRVLGAQYQTLSFEQVLFEDLLFCGLMR